MTERSPTTLYKGLSFVAKTENSPHQQTEKPWYLLPHTGFNVRLQIDHFERDLKEGISEEKSTEEIIETSFQKIEQDIHGFKLEYLSEGLLFPIVLDKEIVAGQERIVAPLYGKKLLVDTISEKERRGAVKESILQVEEFLLNSPCNSIVIMTSPEGWNGFDGITYLDTQTGIFQVQQNGKPIGFTVRTDMTLEENKKLLRSLGKEIPNSASLNDQITDIVARPVFITHSQGQVPWEFADIVNIIKSIKGSHFAYKNRPFSEIYEQLKNPEHLLTIDATTRQLVDELKEFFRTQLLEGPFDRQALEMALGKTILELAYAIRRPKMPSQEQLYQQPAILTRDIPYGAILTELQTLPGCNGGGSTGKISVFGGSFAPRFAVFAPFAQTESKDTSDFPCPRCGHMIIYGSGTKECPSCGLEATCG